MVLSVIRDGLLALEALPVAAVGPQGGVGLRPVRPVSSPAYRRAPGLSAPISPTPPSGRRSVRAPAPPGGTPRPPWSAGRRRSRGCTSDGGHAGSVGTRPSGTCSPPFAAVGPCLPDARPPVFLADLEAPPPSTPETWSPHRLSPKPLHPYSAHLPDRSPPSLTQAPRPLQPKSVGSAAKGRTQYASSCQGAKLLGRGWDRELVWPYRKRVSGLLWELFYPLWWESTHPRVGHAERPQDRCRARHVLPELCRARR